MNDYDFKRFSIHVFLKKVLIPISYETNGEQCKMANFNHSKQLF